jgi:hypothetical protein
LAVKGGGKRAAGAVVLEQKRPPLVARILGIAVVLVLGGVLVVWGIDLGKRIMGASHGQSLPDMQQQLDEAQAEIARLTAERDALQAALKAAGVAPPVVSAGAGSAGAAGPAMPLAASADSAAGPMASMAASAVSPVRGTSASGTITALPPK